MNPEVNHLLSVNNYLSAQVKQLLAANNDLVEQNKSMGIALVNLKTQINNSKPPLDPNSKPFVPSTASANGDPYDSCCPQSQDNLPIAQVRPFKKRKFYANKYSLDDKKVNEILSNLDSIQDIIKLAPIRKKINHNHVLRELTDLIPTLRKLDSLIGMSQVKEQVFELIVYHAQGLNSSTDLKHTVITGPPGVGKTELINILAEIYMMMGICGNGPLIHAKRSDMVAGYTGQTAIKTQKLCDKANGGILALDEAYAIGDKEQRDSFSKEALDTLNRNLTEKNIVCIIAGYADQLENCFFATNPGLHRRFATRFNISSYTPSEMGQIFVKQLAKEKFNVSVKLDEFFEKNIKEFPNFGGSLQVLGYRTKMAHSHNLLQNKTIRKIISQVDLDNGYKSYIDNCKKKEYKPPLGMYC
jgi:SpoVK/Ycf46/Vps4 family AAA+-type ATPase